MRKAFIKRLETGDSGTFGYFFADSGLTLATAELPWRDRDGNGFGDPEVSCINPGVYTCEWDHSTKFGWCYHVRHVPGRSDILIHVGNFVGDREKGLRCDVLGCILPGMEIGELDTTVGKKQKAVKHSFAAVMAIQRDFARLPFELTIVDATLSAAERLKAG